jgi:hypothetical protein
MYVFEIQSEKFIFLEIFISISLKPEFVLEEKILTIRGIWVTYNNDNIILNIEK